MLSIYCCTIICICIYYYKKRYYNKIGYIPFHLPDDTEELKWYHDYLSVQWRIIRHIFSMIMLGLVLYFIVFKQGVGNVN